MDDSSDAWMESVEPVELKTGGVDFNPPPCKLVRKPGPFRSRPGTPTQRFSHRSLPHGPRLQRTHRLEVHPLRCVGAGEAAPGKRGRTQGLVVVQSLQEEEQGECGSEWPEDDHRLRAKVALPRPAAGRATAQAWEAWYFSCLLLNTVSTWF